MFISQGCDDHIPRGVGKRAGCRKPHADSHRGASQGTENPLCLTKIFGFVVHQRARHKRSHLPCWDSDEVSVGARTNCKLDDIHTTKVTGP